MQAKAENRNQFVDIMRGIAMLLVVLQHTMSGCTVGAENTFLFNIAWSLQMPLFILISGYVTKYSRPISDSKGLWKYVKRRTVAYMLPWAVWSFLVRGIIFGENSFLNVKHLLWNMDSGYWFLATIWTINMIYGLADYASNKISKSTTWNMLIHLTLCGVGMIVLGVIGYIAGLSFFCIKLTLYYIPIYLLGYLYGQLQDKFLALKKSSSLVNGVITISLVIWLTMILRFNFHDDNGDALIIVLRFITSLFGCISIIGLFIGIYSSGNKLLQLVHWTGVYSLEIYLTHYLVLNMIQMTVTPQFGTLEGMRLLAVNYLLTIGMVCLIIKILQRNNILNYLLYAKRTLSNF